MQFAKISCGSCQHVSSCPKMTRLFINYCGSRSDQFEKNVRAAKADCRQRRSYFMNQSTHPVLSIAHG